MNGIRTFLGGAAILATIGMVNSCREYADYPGFSEKTEMGRTKNAISAVVAGIAAQQAYGDANVGMEVKKTFWPDATLTGTVTPDAIDTKTNVFFSSAKFNARGSEGGLVGKVDKSEFDWRVEQTGQDTYRIKRLGWKFDSYLQLTAKDGCITGTYKRPGPHFDWTVDGTYTKDGSARIEIDGPLNLGVTLEGKLKQ